MAITVIIPVAEGDEAWRNLLPDLRSLSEEDEVILSSKKSLKSELESEVKGLGLICEFHWAPSQIGRAKQLNAGARKAKSDFFWFLHCDSKLSPSAIEKLKTALVQKSKAIHFFDLKF